jgi:uncharacterized protein (TIGR03083 family)
MIAAEHEVVAGLLGAWALDACTAADDALVRTHLAGCEGCGTEARLLRACAGGLGAGRLPAPELSPPGLRESVLAAARERRRPPIPAAVAPYAAQVRGLDRLLAGLAPDQWQAAAVRDWSVHDLLAHLTAVDGLLAADLGLASAALPGLPPAGNLGPDRSRERTAEVVDCARGQEPDQTRLAWRRQADALVGLAAADDGLADQPVAHGGGAVPAGLALLARGFETWIHADDIRGALGLALAPPVPEHLGQLAAAAVVLLEQAIARSDRSHPGHTARLVLHGDGGGGWVLPLGLPAPPRTRRDSAPDATVSIDLLEFCYLVGGRRDPDRISRHVAGDPRLAADLLAVAAAFHQD